MKYLLAAALGTTLAAAPAMSATNFTSDWDDYPLATGTYTQFQGSVDGWTASNAGIELQNNRAGTPYSGGNLMEMDVGIGNGTTNTVISRAIDAGVYTLRYYYSARPGVGPTSSGVGVSFDNSVLDTVAEDGSAYADTHWSLRTVNFTSLTGGTLSFYGMGVGDTYGGYIDSITLTGTPPAVPEAATWAMFIGGFGLVGGALRTRRKPAITFA